MKKILFLGGSSSQIFAYEEAKKWGTSQFVLII